MNRRVSFAADRLRFLTWLLGLGAALTLALVASAAAAPREATPPAPATSPSVNPLAGLKPAKQAADVVQTREEASAAISADEVSYYVKTFAVSPSVARERLETQGMAPGIGDTLRARWGDDITAVWFDNTSGDWVVATTGEATDENVTSEFRRVDLADRLRIERVSFGRSALAQTGEALAERLTDLAQRGGVRVGLGQAHIDVVAASELSSDDHSALMKAVDDATASAEGPQASVTTSTHRSLLVQPAVSCAFPYCDTLVGGDFYQGPNNGGCTMSWFGSITLNGVVQYIILTAAHCTRSNGGPGSTVHTSSLTVSPLNFGTQYSGSEDNGDWGYMYPYNPPPASLNPGLGRPYGGYINWNSNGLSRLNAYYGSGPAPTGEVVCHQGYGSGVNLGNGTQCGTIGNNDILTPTAFEGFDHYHEMEFVNTNGCKGDSGGPYDLAGAETAVALYSAQNAPPGQQCGTTTYGTPVSTPIQSYAAYNMVLYGG